MIVDRVQDVDDHELPEGDQVELHGKDRHDGRQNRAENAIDGVTVRAWKRKCRFYKIRFPGGNFKSILGDTSD